MGAELSRDTGAEWARAEHVLCVRLDSLGDVLMTTPAIRALRQGRPGRRITLLASPSGAAAARLVPEVDEVIVYQAPWMKPTRDRGAATDLEMIGRLHQAEFGAAAIFTVYSQNPLPAALLCHLAGIPLRLAHCREHPYHLLTDWVGETEPAGGIRHEVRRQLALAASVGCATADERLSLRVPEPVHARVLELLDRAGIDRARPWAVVHPGASAPSRRYPPERFARVVKGLARGHRWQLVLTGSADERGLCDVIREAAGVPARNLAGQVDLAGLAALIQAAPVLVTNNTGPAHVAAAVGTPVVVLYALTNPQHTPWMVPSRVLYHDVPCRMCYSSVCGEGHHLCLRGVDPGQVVRAAVELVDEARHPAPVRVDTGVLTFAPETA